MRLLSHRTICFILFALLATFGAIGQETQPFYELDLGQPASEKQSKITVRSFGEPETLGGRVCRNSDETGLGDNKNGYGAFVFPFVKKMMTNKFLVVEIDIWGESTNMLIRVPCRKGKGQKGNDYRWIVSEPKKLSGEKKWETLRFVINRAYLDPDTKDFTVGFAGHDAQIWISRVSVYGADERDAAPGAATDGDDEAKDPEKKKAMKPAG